VDAPPALSLLDRSKCFLLGPKDLPGHDQAVSDTAKFKGLRIDGYASPAARVYASYGQDHTIAKILVTFHLEGIHLPHVQPLGPEFGEQHHVRPGAVLGVRSRNVESIHGFSISDLHAWRPSR
jgi:hypothetical protein